MMVYSTGISPPGMEAQPAYDSDDTDDVAPLSEREIAKLREALKSGRKLLIYKQIGVSDVTMYHVLRGGDITERTRDKIIAYLEGVEKNGNA